MIHFLSGRKTGDKIITPELLFPAWIIDDFSEVVMKIVVVGCGKIGAKVVASLVEEGHDVVAVDNNPAVLDSITNIYDVMTVCGSGTDCETLQEAGVQSAQLVIAVTASDEFNMLCCYISRRMGAKHSIARIRKPEYNPESLAFLKQQLDLSLIINPEMYAAREMYNILKIPSAVKIESFSGRNFEIIEIVINEGSPLIDLKLMDIRNKFKEKFLVSVVKRGDDVYIPDGNFVLRQGDKIGLTGEASEIIKLMRTIGLERKQARNIMLLGGSRIAYYLAVKLIGSGHRVKIVENDPARCDELSERLPRAVIINGDGAQQEILEEEGLGTTDAFVALTGMDEENILISIFASGKHVPKVIAKVNRSELAAMANDLGVDTVISPKTIIADKVVQYARALENSLGSSVETLYKIMDDKAEVLEFNVKADFRAVNIPLKDLKMKANVLLVGIIRNRNSILPTGNDYIAEGDRVIVASKNRLNDLSDILR